MVEQSLSELVESIKRSATKLGNAFSANQNCLKIVDNLLTDAEALQDSLIEQAKREAISAQNVWVN